MISIRIANRQKQLPLDQRRIRESVRAILRDAHIRQARVSVAVVDDPTIADLHGRYLQDPEPTDVLSFVLEQAPGTLEGEVVVSADTARANAARYRVAAESELLLYVIHGVLHLVGFDDATAPQRAAMRKMERRYLAKHRRRG